MPIPRHKKLSANDLIKILRVEFPYIVEYANKKLHDVPMNDDFIINCIMGNLIVNSLATKHYINYFDFFNIRRGNWNKLRRAILYWIRHNEELIQMRML